MRTKSRGHQREEGQACRFPSNSQQLCAGFQYSTQFQIEIDFLKSMIPNLNSLEFQRHASRSHKIAPAPSETSDALEFLSLSMSHSPLCLSVYKTLSMGGWGEGSPECVVPSECILLIRAGHVNDPSLRQRWQNLPSWSIYRCR